MYDLQGSYKITGEDLQFELVLSYIRHASQKLALKESQLILQSANFIDFITNEEKSNAELSTAQGSSQNIINCIGNQPSEKAIQREILKHKGIDSYCLDQALQQVKQVCSSRSIEIIETVFEEYNKMLDQVHQIDYNKDAFARKQCNNCQQNEAKNTQLQLRVQKINDKLQQLQKNNQQLNKSLQKKYQQLQKLRKSQNTCRAFLQQKQGILVARTNQIKLSQRQIIISLSNILQLNGCQRCTMIKSIKNQIVNFRTYLQRQSQNIDKLYIHYKKQFQLSN